MKITDTRKFLKRISIAVSGGLGWVVFAVQANPILDQNPGGLKQAALSLKALSSQLSLEEVLLVSFVLFSVFGIIFRRWLQAHRKLGTKNTVLDMRGAAFAGAGNTKPARGSNMNYVAAGHGGGAISVPSEIKRFKTIDAQFESQYQSLKEEESRVRAGREQAAQELVHYEQELHAKGDRMLGMEKQLAYARSRLELKQQQLKQTENLSQSVQFKKEKQLNERIAYLASKEQELFAKRSDMLGQQEAYQKKLKDKESSLKSFELKLQRQQRKVEQELSARAQKDRASRDALKTIQLNLKTQLDTAEQDREQIRQMLTVSEEKAQKALALAEAEKQRLAQAVALKEAEKAVAERQALARESDYQQKIQKAEEDASRRQRMLVEKLARAEQEKEAGQRRLSEQQAVMEARLSQAKDDKAQMVVTLQEQKAVLERQQNSSSVDLKKQRASLQDALRQATEEQKQAQQHLAAEKDQMRQKLAEAEREKESVSAQLRKEHENLLAQLQQAEAEKSATQQQVQQQQECMAEQLRQAERDKAKVVADLQQQKVALAQRLEHSNPEQSAHITAQQNEVHAALQKAQKEQQNAQSAHQRQLTDMRLRMEQLETERRDAAEALQLEQAKFRVQVLKLEKEREQLKKQLAGKDGDRVQAAGFEERIRSTEAAYSSKLDALSKEKQSMELKLKAMQRELTSYQQQNQAAPIAVPEMRVSPVPATTPSVRQRVEVLPKTTRVAYVSEQDVLSGFHDEGFLHELNDFYKAMQLSSDSRFVMMMLGFDGFSLFEDSYAESLKEDLYGMVEELVMNVIPAERVLTQPYGRHQYVVVFTEDEGEKEALSYAQELRTDIEQLQIELSSGSEQLLTASIGLAGYPEDSTTMSELLLLSRKACDKAWRAGGNRVVAISYA